MAYAEQVETEELHEPRSFLTRYIWSQDHKVIAIQYALTAIFVGLIALVLSGLMRMQLGFPGSIGFMDAGAYYQAMTMHGMIMVIYLLTALFLGGFGNYLIPLMVGSRDMVFPYVNMLSYWFYLLSVIILLASFFAPGGPTGAGWTLYPPQSITQGTPGTEWGIVLMLVSLAIFIVAATMGGLNYVTTVLQARTHGMTLMRMPLSVWGIFMASILALPAFGLVSDLISTHARKNIFGYRMMVWAIVAIGVLSFVVWAHHMYVSGMNPYFGFFFATTTLIIAVPTALKVYNWVLTLWQGDIHLTVPMLFALAFILTFLVGGLTGLFLGNVIVDIPLSDTYFVVAHFHMVMGVAPILVVFGAIYHWYPKITGRMMNERLGKLHFWITFLGTYAIYFPMHYLGFLGMPRRYYAYEDYAFIPQSAQDLNAFITVAALTVGVAQLLFLVNLFWSAFNGKPAGGNPWKATSLEWQTPQTPPVHGNWGAKLPVVHRWAYDYSVPGIEQDFVPQTVSAEDLERMRQHDSETTPADERP